MIAVLRHGVTAEQRDNLITWLKGQNVDVHVSEGAFQTVLGLIGDTSKIDMDLLAGLDIVDSVMRVTEPFKSANRKFHPDDSVITVGTGENAVKIGGGGFAVIAGPCSVALPLLQDPARWSLRSRSSPLQGQLRHREQICSAEAPSSRAPRPTIFKGSVRKDLSC